MRASFFTARFGLSENRLPGLREAGLAQPALGALQQPVDELRLGLAGQRIAVAGKQRAHDEDVVQIAQLLAERLDRLALRL